MSKNILFIEDESALHKTFAELLKKEGHRMISALNGEIGLNLAIKEKPDLILLDLILPKMDGFEVLEKLLSNPETQNIPVIILTILERNEDIDKALELGAKTYLVKAHYNIRDILEKINQVLGEK